MKLKKIASVALAGVMAVSVLAGCANKPGTDNGEGQGQVETSLTVADVLNQAQSKVKFTNNDIMNAALQAMVAQQGAGAVANETAANNNVTNALKKASINETDTTSFGGFGFGGGTSHYTEEEFTDADLTGLLNGALNYYYGSISGKNSSEAEGTYTAVTAKVFTGYTDAESALKAMAAYMEELTKKLADHSTMTTQTSAQSYDSNPGEIANDSYKLQYGEDDANKYYTMSYTGNAAVIAANNTNGTTSYVLVFVINQDVTEASFGA